MDVFPINISTVTHDPLTGEVHFPDRELPHEFRSILAANTGKPITELLQAQDASLARYTQVVEGQLRRPPVSMRRAPHPVGAPAPRTDSGRYPQLAVTHPLTRHRRSRSIPPCLPPCLPAGRADR
jgi:hypothetical protein